MRFSAPLKPSSLEPAPSFELPAVGRRPARAFTLLELITVILVVAILMVLLVPVLGQIQRRFEKTSCMSNLKSLHVATASYVQDRHNWPQIAITYGQDHRALATAWMEALKPYGIGVKTWLCPTIQKNAGAPDMQAHNELLRIDYIPFPFGRNPQDPFRYANQPWFIETADAHGNGNLMIFPDGHTRELVDYMHELHQH